MTTPTPLARARFFALLALVICAFVPPGSAAPQRPAARSAQAAVEWVEVRYTHAGKTYTYFYPKNKPYTNDGGNERINLYSEPLLDDSKMARSHLWRKPGGGANAPFSLHLITEKAAGAATDIIKNAKNWTASAYRPPAPPPAPPAPQPAPAQPAPAAPAPAPAQPSAPPADPAGGTTVNRPAAPEDIRNGTVVGQDGGPPARLREAMKQGDRWQDVAKRIVPWAWEERANGRSFVSPVARKADASKASFEATMNTVIQDAGHWASAINVYYILGPGTPVPAWVTADPELKKILVDDQVAIKAAKLDEVLVQCLDRWQHSPEGKVAEACDKTIDRNQARLPYPAKNAATWARDFLADAGREALTLRNAVARGRGAIGDAIDRAGDTTVTTPAGGGQRNTTLPAGDGGAFGVDQLFGAWGDPNVFSLDGRTLALVVRTKRTFTTDDPPKPVLKNQLGLYDISHAGQIYGMRFDIDKTGEQVLSLKSGGKQYKITMAVEGEDTKIDIARAQGDAKPVFGGGQKTFPSVNEMFRMRAEKALNSAQSVVIGGETYRVTAESAGTGNLLFWSEKELQRQRDGITKPGAGLWARNLSPNAMAEVNKVQSGAIVNTSETVSLGFTANGGKWQGLRYNKDAGIWIPGEGDEFKPPKAPAAPGTGTPATPPAGGQPPAGNPTTPGAPGGPAPTPAAAEATVARLNSELGPEAAKRVVFFVPDGLAFGRHLGVARRGEDGKPIQGKMSLVMFPGLGDGGTNLREAMHKGRYLITSTDKGFQVDDMLKYDFVDGKIYGTVGVTLSKDKVVRDVTDREALALVLAAAGFQASEAQIMANHAKAIGNVTQWTVVGYDSRHEKPHLNVLLGTSKCVRIHPKYDPAGCTGDESVTATVPGVGQGMALDSVGGATQVGDTAFYDTTEIGTAKATRVEPKAARAGLYLAVDGEKKNWYLTFLIKPKEGGEYKRTHIAFRNAASEAVGVQVEAPPSGLQIGGVTLKGALVETAMKASASESGDLSKAGFIGAYTGSNGACVGVVAWWGVDLKTACDRCGAKMAGNACVEK